MREKMRRSLITAFLAVVLSSLLLFFFFFFFFFSFLSLYNYTLRDVIIPHDTALHFFKPPLAHSTKYDAVSEIFPSRLSSPSPPDAVLFPDWEVLLLLAPSAAAAFHDARELSCSFPGGVTSPARFAGTLPSSQRAMFFCELPRSLRRTRPFYAPALVADEGEHLSVGGERRIPRWNRLVYESVSTPDDIIVFAKGVNARQGVNRPAEELRCVFSLDGGGAAVAETNVSVSVQEVFRCAHPAPSVTSDGEALHVSIRVKGETRAVPSLASYDASRRVPAHNKPVGEEKSLVCACTMVFNVGKFLREWITYHSAIGVERFVLYDNGSEDDLDSVVSQLRDLGHDVRTVVWPWPKTQEAGFSHCAATHVSQCTWMAFIDVDEFIFSPAWTGSAEPNRSMLPALLPADPVGERVGQVSFRCLDFGPSGQTQHPAPGVTQGYTCRRRAEERHKSVVLLEAAAAAGRNATLVNAVHHFGGLWEEAGWRTRTASRREAAVYHYKYQAWSEFKAKFRRRVSAYVADWRQRVNTGSKDRTPGLGFEPVKPDGWEWSFCEEKDTSLADLTLTWFGAKPLGSQHKMVWED